jgi:GNAT superfamily N-acetyltransferase
MGQKLTLIPASEPMKPLITYVAVGEDEDLETQLISKSRQPSILKYTPNDAKKRFGNPAMLKQWRAKGRQIHWLLGADNDLAGIIWYGKSKFPLDLKLAQTPEETFAIRIYDGYAGHGLARPFMELSLKTVVASKQTRGEAITGIWLQTDLDNPAAIAAYTKFGYQEVARDDKRVTMILSSERELALANAGS